MFKTLIWLIDPFLFRSPLSHQAIYRDSCLFILSVLEWITYNFLNMWGYLQNNSRISLSRVKVEGIGAEVGAALEHIKEAVGTHTPSMWQPTPIPIPWEKQNREFPREVMLKGCIYRNDHWPPRESIAFPSTKNTPDKLFLILQATIYMSLLENLQDWSGCSCFCFFMIPCIFAHLIILITLCYNEFFKIHFYYQNNMEYFWYNILK